MPASPLSLLLPAIPALDNTYGCILVGTFIGLMCVFISMGMGSWRLWLTLLSSRLYGMTLHQSYRYFRLYPNDTKVLKALVSVITHVTYVYSQCCVTQVVVTLFVFLCLH